MEAFIVIALGVPLIVCTLAIFRRAPLQARVLLQAPCASASAALAVHFCAAGAHHSWLGAAVCGYLAIMNGYYAFKNLSLPATPSRSASGGA